MSEHDSFDNFLREGLRNRSAYVPDEGFTAGVMAALPAPAGVSRLKERVIIGLGLLLASLLVLALAPLPELALQVWHWSANAEVAALVEAGAGISVGIIAACALWLARQMRLV